MLKQVGIEPIPLTIIVLKQVGIEPIPGLSPFPKPSYELAWNITLFIVLKQVGIEPIPLTIL